MDEKKHYFPKFELDFRFLIHSSSLELIYYFNSIPFFIDILIKNINLVIVGDKIYFIIHNNYNVPNELIKLNYLFNKKIGSYERVASRVVEISSIHHETSVSTIFSNVSQDQWKDLINNNFELIRNIIESYFNELIKSETTINLKKYEETRL